LWLNSQFEGQSVEMPDSKLDDELSIGLGMLFKHARHYIKTALLESPLKGIDDFAFLATLSEEGDLKKSELIRYNLVEFSPGMEVIRRLLRKKLIQDYNDPEDGRSKKVNITAKGSRVLEESLGEMFKASKIIVGTLSLNEKAQFVHIARKLLHFHHPIWNSDHGQPLDVILDKYL
jgi:DNA-binding MarR family transcriptional regulator